MTRRFFGVFLTVLAVSFALSYFGSPVPIAIPFGTVVACGTYSAAVASARKKHVVFLVAAPTLALALAYALTGSLPIALLSLIGFPPSLAMGIAVRCKKNRTDSVKVFAFTAIAELIILVVAYILEQNKTLSFEIIEHAVIYLENGIEWSLRTAIERAGNVPVTEDLLMQIRNMSAEIVNVIPGVAIFLAVAIGYIALSSACSLFERYDKEELLNSAMTDVTVSCTAAAIFLAAHIFSLMSGSSYAPSFVSVVAQNISLALLPALLWIGFSKIMALPRKIGFLALVVWVGLVFAAGAMSASIVTVLALIGTFYTIIVRIDLWAKDHYSKGENK